MTSLVCLAAVNWVATFPRGLQLACSTQTVIQIPILSKVPIKRTFGLTVTIQSIDSLAPFTWNKFKAKRDWLSKW